MFTPRLFKIKMHSRRVLIFKRSLPVFSFLLAVLMLLWPIMWAEQKEQFSVSLPSAQEMSNAKINMEQVRFFAQDKKKQPLTVVAPRVLETNPTEQIITLYKPVAAYKMNSGEEIKAETPYGLVNQNNQTMLLEDQVIATTNTGYKITTKDVVCDNKIGVITGKSPITVTGPDGQIKAQGFRLYNKGDNIDFTGHTDSTLENKGDPIRIETADGLLVDRMKQTVIAVKDVRVTQKEQIITADKMILNYLTKAQNPDSRIEKIEAIGHIIATSGTYRLTGEKGIYTPKTKEIVVTENVVLYQGNNRMEGEQATLNMSTGESHLIPKKGTTAKPGRVKGRLLPTELKGLKK